MWDYADYKAAPFEIQWENRAEKSALFFRAQHFESVGANTLKYGRNLKCWELKVLGEVVKNLTKKFFKKTIDKGFLL